MRTLYLKVLASAKDTSSEFGQPNLEIACKIHLSFKGKILWFLTVTILRISLLKQQYFQHIKTTNNKSTGAAKLESPQNSPLYPNMCTYKV